MTINMMPIRIAVTGITGRMGTEIIRCIIQHQQQGLNNKIVLGAAIVRCNSAVCGMDVGTFVQSDVQGVTITDNIELVKENFDILIDFTHPDLTAEYLKFCMVNSKNMIIGTTGFNQVHQKLIKSASQKIGIVCSANFSIGITIMLKLLTEVSKAIGNTVDIDIIELHHNRKIDIPSGTSLMIQDIIKLNIKNNDLLQTIIFNDINQENTLYQLPSSLIANRDIKIHSIRSGDNVGQHTVLFSSIGETLEITHKASNRKIFANGALYASMWLGKSKIGLFDLNDVLKFKK